MKEKILNSVFVGIGGAIGSLFRYIVSLVYPYDPYPTLFVNLTGSFLLGFITILLSTPNEHKKLKLLLGTGFCGGFTTMSTFSLELTSLTIYYSVIYLIGTLSFGLIFTVVGMKIAVMLVKKETKI